MTDQFLRSMPRLKGLDALILRHWRGLNLAADRHEGWRNWLFEIGILIAVILALSVVLQPRLMLMNASPHPFWLPVVAAALVHGTLPGLVAAVLAGLCAWMFGGLTATTEDDFYDYMFRTFKDPVLWLFSALVLGTFRDRIEVERQRLARERDEARDDLANVVDHATALRERVSELERSIVLAEIEPVALPLPPIDDSAEVRPAPEPDHEDAIAPVIRTVDPVDDAKPRLVAVPTAAPEGPRPIPASDDALPEAARATLSIVARSDAPTGFAWEWACLWEATEHGWRLRGQEGPADVPDAGRLLRHFDQQSRVYDCRNAADRLVLPQGALLASPFRRGLEPATRVIIVGGGHIASDITLGQILPDVLRLADRLDIAAGREDI